MCNGSPVGWIYGRLDCECKQSPSLSCAPRCLSCDSDADAVTRNPNSHRQEDHGGRLQGCPVVLAIPKSTLEVLWNTNSSQVFHSETYQVDGI